MVMHKYRLVNQEVNVEVASMEGEVVAKENECLYWRWR